MTPDLFVIRMKYLTISHKKHTSVVKPNYRIPIAQPKTVQSNSVLSKIQVTPIC